MIKWNSLLALLLCFTTCTTEPPLFRLLSPEKTGVHFANMVSSTSSFNAINFEYIYNGGGVAAVDFNEDGLVDLFFTGNQVSSQLYLNKGNFNFEEVTVAAGLETNRWCTGVAVADVNADGKMDIYISVAGFEVAEKEMENLLFINQGWSEDGIPHFEEQADVYGLNDAGYSTQAAFLDYDLDGDLDLYLLTNAMERFNRNNLRPKRLLGEAESTDRLFQNNGDGTFTNVSKQSGISIEGYGLGLCVADLNFDGYPDIYTANDFLSNDLVWINNQDGTFTNKADLYLRHQTHNGMGVDIADFNNDALPDICVLDMLPADNYRQKMMIPYVNTDKFNMKRQLGYQDQYMRNTLQLHRGFRENQEPVFSEIGQLSGLAATDWSWSVLFADFDNDTWKDVYITNGYRKDITNLDYINYSNLNQIFGTQEAKKQKVIKDLEEIPDVERSNYLFQNTGTLQFKDKTATWGLEKASFSNGAVYADFDNDGDLDLAVNNLDTKAFLFENRSQNANYIQIQLSEKDTALTVYNTKVWIYTKQQAQYQEYTPFRGYKSTVSDILHFGLGTATMVDSIIIQWMDGKRSVLNTISANQRLEIAHQSALESNIQERASLAEKDLFQSSDFDFKHKDNAYSALKTLRTLQLDYAKAGPALAVGDINGDQLDDFFIGGNIDQEGAFFIQDQTGAFTKQLFPFDFSKQAVDALFFDADQDMDQDLYIVYGGIAGAIEDTIYQDCLYYNDGRGRFSPAEGALPSIVSSGSCVRSADFDLDGDLDLFIGGRVVPNAYPQAPRSFLLENRVGKFVDVSPDFLKTIGMLTDAKWADFNGDQREDLILVGEWMSIQVILNTTEGFTQKSLEYEDFPANLKGWWTHINAADIDQDGDLDLLVGNLGLNSKFKATAEQPLKLYAKDFDQNGTIDPLFACYTQGEEYLSHERDLLINQIPAMKRRFPTYSKYALASIDQTLSSKDLVDAQRLESNILSSVLLENKGAYQFKVHKLPTEAQLAPLNGSLFLDINKDGKLDILSGGNYQASETNQIGHFDASIGTILLQEQNWDFKSQSPLNYNLLMDGDLRNIQILQLANGKKLLLLAAYGGGLRGYILPSDTVQTLK